MIKIIFIIILLYFSLLVYVVCKELLESARNKFKLIIAKIKNHDNK